MMMRARPAKNLERSVGLMMAALLLTSMPACFLKQAGGEVGEMDPYAPAAPAAPEQQATRQDDGAQQPVNEGQNTGSDKPVPVDALLASEGNSGAAKAEPPEEAAADPTTRIYSEAYNPDPGYKPAAGLTGRNAETTKPASTGAVSAKTPAKGELTSPHVRGSGAQLMVITVERINIRTSPDRHSRIVGELRRGDKVKVDVDEAAGWARLSDGEFIRSRHLMSAEN